MPGDPVRSSEGHRVLRHPGLRSKHPHRHPVLGLLLDQHRRRPSPGLHRAPHGPNNDDPKLGDQPAVAPRLLHQGH